MERKRVKRVVIKGYTNQYFTYLVHPLQDHMISVNPFNISKKDDFKDSIKVTIILEQ